MTLTQHAGRRLRRLGNRLAAAFRPPMQQLAFLHVPKSAGTAFTDAMERTLRPGRMITGFDASTFGKFTAFDTMSWRTRRQVYLSARAISPLTEFLSGHFAKSTVDAALPHARQMMLLREPSARVLSQWAYWRALPDAKHREWGAWSEYLKLARWPLWEFLSAPAIACQTDNAYVRSLLWPHPLIPDGDFIASGADETLVPAALDAMSALSFVGILEDPGLKSGLEDFLGCRLVIRSMNVTARMPEPLQTSMLEELTPRALQLVWQRSRLDRHLWHAMAQRLMPPQAVESLENATFAQTSARYAELMQ